MIPIVESRRRERCRCEIEGESPTQGSAISDPVQRLTFVPGSIVIGMPPTPTSLGRGRAESERYARVHFFSPLVHRPLLMCSHIAKDTASSTGTGRVPVQGPEGAANGPGRQVHYIALHDVRIVTFSCLPRFWFNIMEALPTHHCMKC